MNLNAMALGALALAGVMLFLRYVQSKSTMQLPPGPPRSFWMGNARQLPQKQPWKTYAEWAKQYGPIMCLRIFSHRMVILSSADDVFALLVKRAALYSERPALTMSTVLVGRKKAFFNISAQDKDFRVYRRLMAGSMNSRAIQELGDMLENENRTFLKRIGSEPENLFMAIRTSLGAIILKIGYGYTITGDDDYFLSLAERVGMISSIISKPGRWLVDVFPILRFIPPWFPGAGFRRQAEAWKKEIPDLYDVPHSWTKKQMDSGKSYEESFTSRNLQPPVTAEEEGAVQRVAVALHLGGTETTAAALKTFFLAMSLHPEVQKRAQAEIDSILATHADVSRLPRLLDRERMPFTDAILKEILRWAPVAPLGLPHCTLEDDYYNGYLIPKGAMVFANIWAILHDPVTYKSPEEFNPDRFMPSDKHGAGEPDPRQFAFGFGRRICPGQNLAEAYIFLAISSVLAAYNISPALDDNGRQITPKVEYSTGITSHPSPFGCCIALRSPSARALLRE